MLRKLSLVGGLSGTSAAGSDAGGGGGGGSNINTITTSGHQQQYLRSNVALTHAHSSNLKSYHQNSITPDEELDQMAVISNAVPEHVTYGSGGSLSTITGPKIVPGIITSGGLSSHMLPGTGLIVQRPYGHTTGGRPRISQSYLPSMITDARQHPNNGSSCSSASGELRLDLSTGQSIEPITSPAIVTNTGANFDQKPLRLGSIRLKSDQLPSSFKSEEEEEEELDELQDEEFAGRKAGLAHSDEGEQDENYLINECAHDEADVMGDELGENDVLNESDSIHDEENEQLEKETLLVRTTSGKQRLSSDINRRHPLHHHFLHHEHFLNHTKQQQPHRHHRTRRRTPLGQEGVKSRSIESPLNTQLNTNEQPIYGNVLSTNVSGHHLTTVAGPVPNNQRTATNKFTGHRVSLSSATIAPAVSARVTNRSLTTANSPGNKFHHHPHQHHQSPQHFHLQHDHPPPYSAYSMDSFGDLSAAISRAPHKSGCNWTFVFDPSGRLCYYWSMIVSLAFLYNFWVIIYRFAFEEISPATMAAWLTLDSLADLIYVLDIGVHFRTGFLEEGVLQTDGIKLRQHYMNSTMFYIDCLCLLPLDFLYLSIGFVSILRCFRLVKIYRFWSFLDRTERHSNYPNLFRMCSLTHYILVTFHWNACLYHLVWKRGLFAGSRESSCADAQCDYLHAFYWSTLALTITGDLPRPITKQEYLFLTLELLCGLFLFASVLGHVAIIVTNVSTARKEFQAKLDSVKTYMRMRRVPEHLKIKVIRWFDYLWMTQKSSDEDKCVGFLPAKLKAEIAIHVHLDTLKRVEIFQNTEAGFLCALVLRLKPILFSPGDYVCRKGEVGKEMYIVSRGKLQVVTDGGKTVLATLRAGSYFGEISILNMGTAGNRRTASVRSVGYSDLFCLSKQDMWDVLKDYPAARVRLEAIACKRLEKYRKEPLKKGRVKNIPTVDAESSQTLRRRTPHLFHPSRSGSVGNMADSEQVGNEPMYQHHQQYHHQSSQHFQPHFHSQQPYSTNIPITDTNLQTSVHLSSCPGVGSGATSFKNFQQAIEIDSIPKQINNLTMDLTKPMKTNQHLLTSPSAQNAINSNMYSSVLSRGGLYSPSPVATGAFVSTASPKTSSRLFSSLIQTASPVSHSGTVRSIYGNVLTSATASVGGFLTPQPISMVPIFSNIPVTPVVPSTTTTVVNVNSTTPTGQESLYEQVFKLNQRLQTLEIENTLLHSKLKEQRNNVQCKLSELQHRLNQPSPVSQPTLLPTPSGNSVEQLPKNVQTRERSHSLTPSKTNENIENIDRTQDVSTIFVVEMNTSDLRSKETEKDKPILLSHTQTSKEPFISVDEDAMDDEELISILSEDSERNKESTI